jgi:hypothetical protein
VLPVVELVVDGVAGPAGAIAARVTALDDELRHDAMEAQAVARRADEEARIAALVADGVASARITYEDGGQHPAFAALIRRGANFGEVSRPEALAWSGREIVIAPARAKPTLVAGAAPAVPRASPAHQDARAGSAAPPESLQVTLAATTFGSPRPRPLDPPALFGAVALVAPRDGSTPRSGADEPVPGSVRILPTTLEAARFEVAAHF